jgi:hypothetical protein
MNITKQDTLKRITGHLDGWFRGPIEVACGCAPSGLMNSAPTVLAGWSCMADGRGLSSEALYRSISAMAPSSHISYLSADLIDTWKK